MTPDRLPTLLTHEEYTGMMRDLDTAGHWMRGQLALKQSTAGASQMAADACQAIDDNHSSTQPHARREA
ncbi:hypothetical protein AO287_21195 [Pseudomonas savastanoi]|uniref:Uncharacterized protein n=1 Tax=Pseudomonas savastanoi TaxID=29438 RepID=A0AAW3LSN2_PSESS|nr:hypothetical protein AO287_21195 [Pseudomonas savastanoi]